MSENQMPECWQDFADVIGAGVGKVLLYGLPGTGKTYAGLKQGKTEGGAFRLICSLWPYSCRSVSISHFPCVSPNSSEKCPMNFTSY